jgi:DNA (cytosine-5)-methyltransferase 1
VTLVAPATSLLPTMADVRAATGTNGLVAASVFCGCGGSSLGYRLAGFRIAYAADYAEEAIAPYRLNADAATVAEVVDVRAIDLERFERATGIGKGELDLLDGSPPCQPFSMAGSRQRNWDRAVERYGAEAQTEVDLTSEFARLVDALAPRVFVMENVAALGEGVAIGHLRRFLAQLRAAGPGYQVRTAILDASWLGVPQARERFVAVGTRSDLDLRPPLPVPLGYRTTLAQAFDAAGTVPLVPSGRTLPQGEKRYREAGTAVVAKRGYGRVNVADVRFFTADMAAPTVTGAGLGGGGLRQKGVACTDDGYIDAETGADMAYYTHPWMNKHQKYRRWMLEHGHDPARPMRSINLREARAICSFPLDFVLTGPYKQRWLRLGMSVPPLMTKAVGDCIAKVVA